LLLGGEILADEADASLLRDGDRERRLIHRVHRGRDERDVELDVARQPGLEADIAGQDAGVGRYEKDVVKGESLLDWTHCHTQKSDRKSTRLNSSHVAISYAVFCLKKKKKKDKHMKTKMKQYEVQYI